MEQTNVQAGILATTSELKPKPRRRYGISLRRILDDSANAVLVKELRQELKSRSFVHAFVWFHALMLLLTMVSPAAMKTSRGNETLDGFFWFIIGLLLLGVIPLKSFAVFNKESRAGELELIWMTNISSRQIVFYKWLSLCLQSVLLVTGALPYAIVRYFLSSASFIDGAGILFTVLLSSMVLSAVGTAASAINSSRTKLGFVTAVVAVIIGGPLFGVVINVISQFMRGASSGRTEFFVLACYAPLFVLGVLAFGAASLAPPTENHALGKRLIGAAGFVLAYALTQLGIPPRDTFVLMSLLIIPICIGALCEPIQHALGLYANVVRSPWRRRNPLRFLGYPGWAGGLLYTLLVIGLLFIVYDIPGSRSSSYPGYSLHGFSPTVAQAAYWMVGGLLLPAVVIRLILKRERGIFLLYLAVQVALLGLGLFFDALRDYHDCSASNVFDLILSALPLSAVGMFGRSRYCIEPGITSFVCTAVIIIGTVQWVRAMRRICELEERAIESLQARGEGSDA